MLREAEGIEGERMLTKVSSRLSEDIVVRENWVVEYIAQNTSMRSW